MSNYFAEFVPLNPNARAGPPWLRYNTRIYIDPIIQPSNADRPIASIVAINPGSAMPPSAYVAGTLAPLILGQDKTLSRILNAFINAINDRKNRDPYTPNGNYIQVFNLFYLCNPDLGQALNQLANHGPFFDPNERCLVEPVWFAWGASDKQLNPLKQRFLTINPRRCLYWDCHQEKPIKLIPSLTTTATHPRRVSTLNTCFISSLADLL